MDLFRKKLNFKIVAFQYAPYLIVFGLVLPADAYPVEFNEDFLSKGEHRSSSSTLKRAALYCRAHIALIFT